MSVVDIEADGAIWTITFNRPARRNASAGGPHDIDKLVC